VDRKSIEQLKFDRRLVRRKNWISEDELKRELEALPDVSHKVATEDDEASDSPDGDAAGSDSDARESFS
jgi:hypothetical protein